MIACARGWMGWRSLTVAVQKEAVAERAGGGM
jgi:hypothetical protein